MIYAKGEQSIRIARPFVVCQVCRCRGQQPRVFRSKFGHDYNFVSLLMVITLLPLIDLQKYNIGDVITSDNKYMLRLCLSHLYIAPMVMVLWSMKAQRLKECLNANLDCMNFPHQTNYGIDIRARRVSPLKRKYC